MFQYLCGILGLTEGRQLKFYKVMTILFLNTVLAIPICCYKETSKIVESVEMRSLRAVIGYI